MIIVIADDFTGAAELAGISIRYGLKLNVYLNSEEFSNNSPLEDGGIISTDSRSLKKIEALKVTADAVSKVVSLKPSFIYKKIDSVLRGYVIVELKVQMELSGFNKAFILPANPSLGRTIMNGEYFIEDKRINETAFATDPEFPIKSSSINEIVNDDSVRVLRHSEVLPSNGFVVGEASNEKDIKEWANKLDNSWMLAGAGDFYTALLDRNYQPKLKQEFETQLPHLYVCGTAFKERKEFIKKLSCVSYLPEVVNEDWLKTTGDIIKQKQKAVIAIDETNASALSLRTNMAKAVKEIAQRESIKEIFIEGGSTAAAILQELDIKKLSPVNELERGVVRMKAKDLFITVKPGSYELPGEILRLYS
jgi:uncharacterized protein YgbK (DUF1537 family)